MSVDIQPIVKGQTDWHIPLNSNLNSIADALNDARNWLAPEDIGAAPTLHADPSGKYGVAGVDLFGHVQFAGVGDTLDKVIRTMPYEVVDISTHPFGNDFNNYTKTGIYVLRDASVAPGAVMTMVNIPSTTAGASGTLNQGAVLMVFDEGNNHATEKGTYIKQLLFLRGTTMAMRYRQMAGTPVVPTWYVWVYCATFAVGSGINRKTQYALTANTTLSQTYFNGNIVATNSTAAITLTIPTGLAAGSSIQLIRYGAGTVTIALASGVTIPNTTARTIASQYGTARIFMYSSTVALLLFP